MCGRYQLTIEGTFLVDEYNLGVATGQDAFRPRYNVAPTQHMPVVRQGERGREAVPMRWGLVPFWMKPKNDKMPAGWINARAETAAEKPAFRAAYKRRRCLIPATGFYEWQARDDGPKVPHLIRLADEGVMTFAGLWETWTAPDGSEADTYTVLTTAPNEVMRPIHDRMPVMLDREAFNAWLDSAHDPRELLNSYPPDQMYAVPVATTINSPRNDEPGAVEVL